MLTVVPPSWRPDLTDPADLAEEVIRLEGYEQIPVREPRAAAGRGLTERQRLRRTTGGRAGRHRLRGGDQLPRSVGPADFDRLLLPADDPRREALALANPLSDDEPLLRTVLLPGLLRVLGRNIGRGFTDLGLFETGLVFRPGPDGPKVAPMPGVDQAPSPEMQGQLEAALPDQPLHLAVVAGQHELLSWAAGGGPEPWLRGWMAGRCRGRPAGVLEVSRVTVRGPRRAG